MLLPPRPSKSHAYTRNRSGILRCSESVRYRSVVSGVRVLDHVHKLLRQPAPGVYSHWHISTIHVPDQPRLRVSTCTCATSAYTYERQLPLVLALRKRELWFGIMAFSFSFPPLPSTLRLVIFFFLPTSLRITFRSSGRKCVSFCRVGLHYSLYLCALGKKNLW